MQKGDAVFYIPHEIHSKQMNRQGDFPWIHGMKTGKKNRDGSDEVVELTHSEAALKFNGIRNAPESRRQAELKRLVMVRPATKWSAIVRDVRTVDGKQVADLDIVDATTLAILHYDGVPIDATGLVAHTCHEDPNQPVKQEAPKVVEPQKAPEKPKVKEKELPKAE